ncbi:MAG: type II secretion system secretin GspD [Gammaproteobacteria bacterium]|nr:type II secretion system secretin GspD [Gammaproteobacteria bacterium]
MRRNIAVMFVSLLALALSACSIMQRQESDPSIEGNSDPLAGYSVLSGTRLEYPESAATREANNTKPDSRLDSASGGLEKPIKFPGSNRYVKVQKPVSLQLLPQGDGIVLNFENADLREVVRTILGDFLKVDYLYDPKVQGTVTLQTTKPLASNAVLATLETLLRMNGAALITGDPYRVVTAEEAQKAKLVPQLGDDSAALPPGFQVMIAPLQFVAAAQMEKVLEPFVTPQSILRVDSERNLLVLAGTSRELGSLLETIDLFDVDWLAGKSIGLFPLTQVTPEDMVNELNTIFGTDQDSPLAGMVRFQPINRLNALLVISAQSAYLNKVEQWIERLDRSSSAGQNLYVYYLQNGKAADIAKILTEVFSGRGENRRNDQAGRLAPGLKPVELESSPPPAQAAEQPAAASTPSVPPVQSSGAVRTSEGLAFSESADIRIIADEINNSLLILASPPDYRMVIAAISKLDIVPLQVLIEATIAEVTLTDKMRFGLQWFFESGQFTGTLSSGTGGGTAAGILSTFPGFSLVYENADAKAILDALDSETSVNVVSSPHLMVLDNQTASLQVGDEVPVTTRQQQSTATDTANIVNTIEYRDTGVIMNVTPRVNAGGSIIMEIEQEVSTVAEGSAGDNNTPTISQRKFKSSVVVQSGDTIVLGGLISDQANKTRSGLPFLSELPVVGVLFGQTSIDDSRKELVMLITPRLVRNRFEARRVTEEVRKRLNSLRQLQGEFVPTPIWDALSPKRRAKVEQQIPTGR